MIRLLLLASLLASPAFAEPQIAETRHKDWVEVCVTDEDVARCEAIQVLSVTQGEQSQAILRATLSRVNDERFIEFALPLGMDLRSGLVAQIDEADEIRFGYSTCVPQGCAGVLPLSDELFAALRAGSTAKLGFRAFGNPQVQVLEISLSGLTAASKNI